MDAARAHPYNIEHGMDKAKTTRKRLKPGKLGHGNGRAHKEPGKCYQVNPQTTLGGLEDKILVPKPPQNCATCGNPVDGLNCRHCVFVRKCLNEGWYTIHDENEILNTSKSSKNNTNVVSAPQEPVIFNQDPGVNSSQSPLQINHNCCYKCGDLLDGIFCQQCTCKSCGNGAHIGYNCPPKVSIISNPEQCNQTINELPQTLLSVHLACNSGDENSFTYDFKPNFANDSPNVFNPPPQPQYVPYSCELCGNDSHYGYDCLPQVPFFPIKYLPQETSREILQAQEDLMEAIQAFLKEYDHIPPNEKCMALLLAEERFLKIKQAMEEEQNQPEVLQELLLKLINDLQILKGIQQEKKKPTAQSSIPYWNSSMIDDEEARDNFLKDVCTFLRKFSRIPFGVTPKVILIAWESFGEIKDALMDKQYRQEDIQELMSKLLEDVRNISEEFSEYINCPSWNRPLFYFDDDDDEYTVIWRRPKAITPDEPSEEPEDPLIMGEKELSTIPEKDKSSVEDLDPIPSGSKGVSDDIYDHSDAESLLSQDIPITSPKIDFLSEEFAGEFAPILPEMDEDEFDEEEVDCYDISSDDDSYENIEYVEASPLNLEYDSVEEENEDQEEKEFDLEDIFQIQDVILREKLLNVYRLITNIESLKNNPTPDHVLESPSSFHIPVVDSDSFFEESDTSFSHSDNYLPEFETFSDHTEETRSGSTTTHANNSLPKYDSFLFKIEPDQGGLTGVVISDNSNDPLLELLEFE
ncbi:hypothetical protein Tco_0629889 [Tanacetum coccineum]|uniref:CCHC-type domain-containing protein n=1 Tax=Tanacetum coccineum TaxID=301880 RepID=A0ABQ4WUJ0_9ASTR